MVEIPTNTALLREILTGFIRNEVQKTGLTRVVVGLSGGVDSALSAMLAAEALGAENVLAVLMPYKSSHRDSLAHAEMVVKKSGIESLYVDISAQIDSYFERFPDADQRRRGNKMARERMTILYDHSLRWGGLVLGTSNKTELLLGYGTIYGDTASAINPLGDLYKTQVWALAEAIGVPEVIVAKVPSADLWAGQTDEGELGFTYREVDQLLYLMVDQRYTKPELVAAGFAEGFIDDVAQRIMATQFKRRLPVIAKVSQRTIDRDFRYSRDWGK
ncbi:MAG TPA: NAD+ synthase [Candidatus Binatia bacterium]|nr:NAD+ synthase [Candidatus Binatia bacterium]